MLSAGAWSARVAVLHLRRHSRSAARFQGIAAGAEVTRRFTARWRCMLRCRHAELLVTPRSVRPPAVAGRPVPGVTALPGQLVFSVRGASDCVATLREPRRHSVACWHPLLPPVASQRLGAQRRKPRIPAFPLPARLWHGTCSDTARAPLSGASALHPWRNQPCCIGQLYFWSSR
jgi:hypothetical protein